jgi:hypothetical protein
MEAASERGGGHRLLMTPIRGVGRQGGADRKAS